MSSAHCKAASSRCMATSWMHGSTNCCPPSGSARKGPNARCAITPAAGRCASRSERSFCRTLTCCCWTSPPTTWTWKRFSGLRDICWSSPQRWWSSATTAPSWIGSATRSCPPNAASPAAIWATTRPTLNRNGSNRRPPRPRLTVSRKRSPPSRPTSIGSAPVPPAAPRPRAARSNWTRWSWWRLQSNRSPVPASAFHRLPAPARRWQ